MRRRIDELREQRPQGLTRVDVTTERQNQALPESVNSRARSCVCKPTVEGLSVAAVTHCVSAMVAMRRRHRERAACSRA